MPTALAANAPHNSSVFLQDYNDRVKASRAAGHQHLDEVSASVETLRGQEIYYCHDTKVRGVIRTVGSRGDILVNWSDDYSAEKELAVSRMDGNKVVRQSTLTPHDKKDYVMAVRSRHTQNSSRSAT